jgi:hypothetical protein
MAVLSKTRADIRADIRQRLDELSTDPFLDAELDDYIDLAVVEWSNVTLCCRQEVTVSLTASTRSYDLIEGVLLVKDGYLTTSGDVWKWNLGPIRREAVFSMAGTTGDPTHYFVYGWKDDAAATAAYQRQIHFYPIPGTTGQKAVMDCATMAPTLTADTHIPKIPPEHYNGMYDYVYYLGLERDNDARAQLYHTRFETKAKKAAVSEQKLQRDATPVVGNAYGGGEDGVKPPDRNVGTRLEHWV